MVNSGFHLLFCSRNFGFQSCDAILELVDRERIQILSGQCRQRIVRTLRKKIVRIHDANVDRRVLLVNNIRERVARGTHGMNLPERMTAIGCDGTGGPEVLQAMERPLPVPGPGEVLIRVAAAGVNRPDVAQRLGNYAPPPGTTDIPGLELAGEIVALGEGIDAEILGRPVCALVPGGGYAEYAVAPLGQCLPVPDGLSMVEAAALPETLFTVWTNVFERAYARDGEKLLVHGGTSGIGTMAIKLARLFGLEVFVTCGSDEKCAAARALGATGAINYRTQDFVAEVKAATGGAGVDIVLDMVGGDYLPRNLDCLAEDGRHVSIAIQRGPKAEIPIWKIMTRRLTLTGSTLRARSVGFKTLVAQEIETLVWPFVADGSLRPVIDTVLPLRDAAEAHRRMESSAHVGKIVLEVSAWA